MPADQQIDYIEFPAADIEAVKAFYSAVFGWSFTDYGPDYTAFNDGRLDGGFFKADSRAAQADGAALVVFYAADLEALQARIEAAGGRIVRSIFSFPGGRRFHFTDPDGYELAVWTEEYATRQPTL